MAETLERVLAAAAALLAAAVEEVDADGVPVRALVPPEALGDLDIAVAEAMAP